MELSADKQYQWNPDWANRIVHTLDVSKVVAELEAIEESRGKITPEYILESSKNKTSVLHTYFQWDDEKAAHQWRLRQAKQLLRGIEVKIIKDGRSKSIKVFHTVKKDFPEDFGYKTFNPLSEANISQVKEGSLIDLKRIKNKLSIYGMDKASHYIELAMEELLNHKAQTPVKSIAV